MNKRWKAQSRFLENCQGLAGSVILTALHRRRLEVEDRGAKYCNGQMSALWQEARGIVRMRTIFLFLFIFLGLSATLHLLGQRREMPMTEGVNVGALFPLERINLQTDRYICFVDGRHLSFRDFLQGLKESQALRKALTKAMATSRFDSFFWETPLFNRDKPMEFVLINAPDLSGRAPDSVTFDTDVLGALDEVKVMDNFGGDAKLVIPLARAKHEVYTQLATFVRGAPTEQIDQLWRTIGDVGLGIMEKHPRWLNTAGEGVSWLHIRFDSRPKYYKYTQYKHK